MKERKSKEEAKSPWEVVSPERAVRELAELLGCVPYKGPRNDWDYNTWDEQPNERNAYKIFVCQRSPEIREGAERTVRSYFRGKGLTRGCCEIRSQDPLSLMTIEVGAPLVADCAYPGLTLIRLGSLTQTHKHLNE